jgi:hypothetical protein
LNYTLNIDIDALNDIKEAVDWSELQLEGLGIRYKNQVKKQINSLKKNPHLFIVKTRWV